MNYEENTEKTRIILNKNQYEFELDKKENTKENKSEGDDGLFTPAPKIEVSESAKAVMERGVYGANYATKKNVKV